VYNAHFVHIHARVNPFQPAAILTQYSRPYALSTRELFTGTYPFFIYKLALEAKQTSFTSFPLLYITSILTSIQALYRLASSAMWHWVTCGAPPSTSNNLFFSVNYRTAQSLAATSCGCLSKDVYILRQQLRQFSRGYTNHIQCIISRNFTCNKKDSCSFVPLSHTRPDPGDASDCVQ